MADLPAVRVRPVRGRTIDPFRGTPGEDDDRLASRTVDSQPIGDVAAVLERLPGVKLNRAGRRFSIGRGHDVIKVAFASAARRVSLDDATFEGDGNLVITALHALLPLFGAVEVRIGSYSDVIDGHETLAQVLERYDAWWIDESLKLARELGARDAAKRAAPPAAAHQPARAVQATSTRLRIAFAIIVVVLVVALSIGIRMSRGAKIGEYCTKNTDCRSEACLPQESVSSWRGPRIELSPNAPLSRDPAGVCTETCMIDDDCPRSMKCDDVIMSFSSIGHQTRKRSCVPRAWF